MIKETVKKNQSSMQVLKTLKLLLSGDYTMSELIEKLNEKEDEPIFNNSVISKYINTCRLCDIDIPKIQNRYFVAIVDEEMSSNAQKNFQDFVDILNRYANKKITRIEKGSIISAFESFERAINNKKKVTLLFKNQYKLEGIPVDITAERGKTFFLLYCKNRIRMIDTGRLSGIKISDKTFLGYDRKKTVVFKLKDKLAKRYELRPEETLVSSNADGSITVSNECCNMEMLLLRLMRYDNLCEICNPAEVREQMKTLVDDTLKNYGIE